MSDKSLSRVIAVIFLWLAGAASADVRPVRLTCEYLVNPVGIDVAAPRLSWVLASADRGEAQTGWRVLVAAGRDALDADTGDLWDSGKVASPGSIHVVYAGLPLAAGQRVYWKVRVWDRRGRASPWSEPAFWEMGLPGPEEWTGQWICGPRPLPARDEDFYADSPAPLLRREFTVRGPVRRARAYVSGLGYAELRCNGKKVGDAVLDPAWTSYARRVLYSTHDVTDLLKEGRNAVGLVVGNGWYNPLPMRMWGRLNLREHLPVGPPRAILQLEIEYADGSRDRVVTGADWKAGDGPILRNSVYLGEVYDARREQPGWDRPDFDDSHWLPAVPATQPVGPLRAQRQPPIRVTRTVRPVAILAPRPGVRLVDMGQNFAGVVRLKVRGRAGTRVNLRYGELLYPDGSLNGRTAVCGQIKKPGVGGPGAPDVAWQADAYVLKGQGEEEYTPRFTFHGFRYVEVTGLEGAELLSLEGLRMNSDVAPAGAFSCSSPMLDRIQTLCEWTLLSNLFGVQSDCPHREKFGYGGDVVAASEFALLNFDMAAFYAKVVADFADAARDGGGLTETAPFVGIADEGLENGVGPIGWGTVHPMLLWQLYQYYGDLRLLEEQYETARRWVEFLRSHAAAGLIEKCIGDHESLAPKTTALASTAFYHYNVSLLARMAGLLGRSDEAKQYAALAGQIRDAFNARFLAPATGQYDTGTQAAQAFALYFGLVPGPLREKALALLVDDVQNRNAGRLTTGIFGTKYLLNVLTDAGRADVAYAVVARKDFPGWGHMLEKGATTLWEHWAFSDDVYSHNHPMFGSVSEWFFKALAGIRVADDAVGADRLVIRPQPVGDLTWAQGQYRSIRGTVASRWRIEAGSLDMEVSVPVGATATVFVPAGKEAAVFEGDRPAREGPGVQFLRFEPGAAVYSVGSGTYKFRVQGYRPQRP